MKRTGKALGVKLNDVVMTICAGGLRRYLDERHALPARSLVAAVPVSLRELGDESMNNQVTMMLCSLATDIADPIARLKAINGSSAAAKAMLGSVKGAIFQDYAFLGAPLLLHSMMSLYGQSGLANWMTFPANVVISNVPGPAVPLYVGEAKVSGLYPVSIPTHGCGAEHHRAELSRRTRLRHHRRPPRGARRGPPAGADRRGLRRTGRARPVRGARASAGCGGGLSRPAQSR